MLFHQNVKPNKLLYILVQKRIVKIYDSLLMLRVHLQPALKEIPSRSFAPMYH